VSEDDFTGTATVTDVTVSENGLTITVTTEALTDGDTLILGAARVTDVAGNLSPTAAVTATAVDGTPATVTAGAALIGATSVVFTANEALLASSVSEDDFTGRPRSPTSPCPRTA
jgi:hypothetical protein